MAVRPSWVNVKVDGRVTSVGTGPLASTGGLTAKFYVRENGGIREAVTVETSSDGDEVVLSIYNDYNGKSEQVYQLRTKY